MSNIQITPAGINQLTGDVTGGPGNGAVVDVVAKIAGTTVVGTTGTTNVVFSNSPTLITPSLDTAAAVELDVNTIKLDSTNKDVILTRAAAATLQHGDVNSATPVAQTVQAQGSRSGTDTNVGGANLTIQSGTGTGSGAISSVIIKAPTAGSTGTAAQTMTTSATFTSGGTTFPARINAGADIFLLSSNGGIVLKGLGSASYGHTLSIGFSSSVDGYFCGTGFALPSSTTEASADTFITRGGVATTQLGLANAASPVAQTLQSQGSRSGTDTNIAGANLTEQPGTGTGNSTPSVLIIKGPAANGVTGTAAQTQVTRLVVNDTKALTSGVATTVLSIPLATLQMCGGYVSYAIECTDGTNNQVLSGSINYAGENSAGVFVVSPTVATGNNQLSAVTAASTLVAVWSLTGANPALLQVTATTSLTATRFTIIYEVHHMGQTQPTI